MTGRVRLPQILRVFGWTGLTSLGGGRSVYFHYTLARSGVQDWATGALALLAAVVL